MSEISLSVVSKDRIRDVLDSNSGPADNIHAYINGFKTRAKPASGFEGVPLSIVGYTHYIMGILMREKVYNFPVCRDCGIELQKDKGNFWVDKNSLDTRKACVSENTLHHPRGRED